MPTIEISKKDIEKLVKKPFTIEKLTELLEMTKVSVENVEKDKLIVKIEDTNRADLLSTEGIARELKGLVGRERKLATYPVEKSSFIVKVSHKVKSIRPFTVCAVVKDLHFTEKFIEQIVQLQEKLCDTFGRRRKEAAIGIYDFDKIKWPITYTTYKPEALSFTPLGLVEKLNLKQIVEKHEKGQAYGHLLKDKKEYPIFIDADKNVLSMPPIINSDYSGKITEKTKNVFIEVSGFDLDKLSHVLNITVSALAERGGKIYSVIIKDRKKITTPFFKTKSRRIKLEEINSLLGLDLKPKQVIDLLTKLRYGVKQTNNQFVVEIPFYRQDIIHNVDLIEDIAINYGFKNFKPVEPKMYTTGGILETTKRKAQIADLLTGLEFQEIASFLLSNKKEQFDNVNMKKGEIVELINPYSETFTCLRKWLLPSLIKFLSNNTTKDYPQKIFEIGLTTEPSPRAETKTKDNLKLALAISHAKANFTEAVQVLDYILKNKKLEYSLVPKDYPYFIPGRSAEIKIKDKIIGFIGELSPQTISNWNLKLPVSCIEIDFNSLF
ncbi:MAG: phenylalanine--tRNA ligase subunit beta [archaeon]|nr:MAG: phenylalanine--tRNA ligase subunit beta [archaeon]